jgi:hypothetical protein
MMSGGAPGTAMGLAQIVSVDPVLTDRESAACRYGIGVRFVSPRLSSGRSGRTADCISSRRADRAADRDEQLDGRVIQTTRRHRIPVPTRSPPLSSRHYRYGSQENLAVCRMRRKSRRIGGFANSSRAFDHGLKRVRQDSLTVRVLRPLPAAGESISSRTYHRADAAVSLRPLQRHCFRPPSAYLSIPTRKRCTRAARALT